MGAVSGSGLSLGTLWVAIVADVQEALQAFQKFGNDLGQIVDQQKAKFEGLATVGDSFTRIGTALTVGLTAPLVGVGAAAVKVSEDLNQARVSFTTMLGSAEDADRMLKDLQKFAATTPFEFPELVDAAKRMQALGISAQNVIPYLTSIGDAAAAMGGGKEVIDGITLALGQMSAKGKVSAQEMNQLAERGIPAWQLLADKIGTSIPEAMKLAEKGAIAASTAIPAILEGMNQKFGGSMQALNQTLSGQWSNLKDQLTQTLQGIGQALTPVLTALVKAMGPLLTMLQTMVQWFGQLPQPVQTFVIALGGILAALGPILLLIGQFAATIAAIGPALGALGITLSVSVGVLLGWAAAIAAAVAALIALGAWVYSNWDKIMSAIAGALSSVVKGFDQFVGWVQKIVPATSAAGIGLADLRKNLQDYEAELDKTAKKTQEFTQDLAKSGKSIKDLTEKDIQDIKNTISQMPSLAKIWAKGVMEAEKDIKDAGVQTTKELQATLDQRKKAYEGVLFLYRQGKATALDVAAAEVEVAKAEKQVIAGSPNLVAARKAAADAAAKQAKELEELGKKEIAHEKAMAVIPNEYYRWIQSVDAWNEKADEQKKKLEEQRQAQVDTMVATAAWATNITNVVTPATEQLTRTINDLVQATSSLTPQVNKTYDALKALGLTAADSYRTAADEAKNAYDALVDGGETSFYQLTQARLIWLEAEKQAALAEGEIWDAAHQAEIDSAKKTLDQLEQKTAKHTQKTKTIWQEWGHAIGQTIQQTIGAIVERIFSGSDLNKQLDEQAADLQRSLAERTQEYEQFVTEMQGKQAQATQEYEDALAKEDQAFADSIAQRQKEYEDYAAGLPDLIEEAEARAAEQFTETTDSLKSDLAERTLDYNRYVEDVTSNIEEIRTKHAEALAGELADLQQSLEDRRQEYEDFVYDAETKLSRLREKTSDNIADETQDVEDNIRDRTKDYERYAQDTGKKIAQARAKNNGVYSDEEDDLNTSLRRRQEDLQQYIADQRRDLETFRQRQQQQQAQEEADLRTSLDRKAREQQEYEAGIQRQRDEAVAKHNEQQQQEIADQQLALTRRTQDYDTYLADNQAQMEKAAADYQTQVDTDRAALEKSLADRKAALDQFLFDEEQKHATTRDNIRQTYVDTTTGLETELAKQKADYEAFKNDIIGPGGKLEELKNQHTTIWGDIGGIVVGALGKMGEKMLEIAGEKYLGVLLTKLGDLIGAGTKLGGILDTIGRGLGGAPGISAPTPAPSPTPPTGGAASGGAPSGGGGGGGLLNWVTGISSAVSAVADVLSLFGVGRGGEKDRLNIIANATTALAQMFGNPVNGIVSIINSSNQLNNLNAAMAGWVHDAWMELLDDLAGILSAVGQTRNVLGELLNVATAATAADSACCDRMATALDRIGVSTERSMNMNLYGTDPTLVATQIATQLRLQGARA